MTRNDTFFKILFAIELALIPMVIFAYHFVDQVWTMPLIIAGILVCRVWMEIFKNKHSFQHHLINSIGSVITIGLILIFMACVKLIMVPVAVITFIVMILANALKLCFLNKSMPEIIDAIDFCYVVFECLILLALMFVVKTNFVANIAMFAVIITGIVSSAYKIFYACKYTDLIFNIKKIFRRK